MDVTDGSNELNPAPRGRRALRIDDPEYVTNAGESTEPKGTEPTSAEPTRAEPTSAEPKSAEPTSAEPKSAEPTSAEPKSAEPKIDGLDQSAPELAQPVTAPELAQPVTAPELAQPGTAPELAQPGTAPELAQPVTAPELAQPVTVPELAQPVTVPELAQPVTAPELAQPHEHDPAGIEPAEVEPNQAHSYAELAPVADAQVEFGTEPSTVRFTDSVTGSVTEPVADAQTKFGTEPSTVRFTDSVTEPVTGSVTEPVADAQAEFGTAPVTEPVTELITEPVTGAANASTGASESFQPRPQSSFAAARAHLLARAETYRTALRTNLLGAPLTDRFWGWFWPVLIAMFAGVLRFWNLGNPRTLIFDETYYVKGAYTLMQSGTDLKWPEDVGGVKINAIFESGKADSFLAQGDFVVHPPIGKLLIGIGEQMFGITNTFGWRFVTALLGVAMVLMLARVSRRIFRSTLLGSVTGLFLAIDGLAIVQSRTSLLDQYVAFFALAAFALLVLDRDQSRARLADRMAELVASGKIIPAGGPKLGFRYYRLAAGIALGLCCGSKWSGIYFVAIFGLMTVLWDLNARRVAGVPRYVWGAFWPQGVNAFLAIVPVALLTYLASWSGWFISTLGWGKGVVEKPGFVMNADAPGWLASFAKMDAVPGMLRDFAYYHWQMYNFSVTLTSEHPYMAKASMWLLQLRPTSYYYESYTKGVMGCEVEKCSAAITSLGNPILWWAATLALLVCIFFWISRRDWRAGAVIAGILAGYAPWFLYWDRTIFTFYSIVFESFLWIGLTYMFGMMIGDAKASRKRRREGYIVLAVFVVLAIAVSAFFYPIWTAQVIPYEQWRWRMWLPSWV